MIPTEDMLHFAWITGEKAASIPTDIKLHPATGDLVGAYQANYGYDILNSFIVDDHIIHVMAFGSGIRQSAQEEFREERGGSISLDNGDQLIGIYLGYLLDAKIEDPQFVLDSRIIEREVGMWCMHELMHAIDNIKGEDSVEIRNWYELYTKLNEAIESGNKKLIRKLEKEEKIAYYTTPEDINAYEAQRIADLIFRFRLVPPSNRKSHRNVLRKWVSNLEVAYKQKQIYDEYFNDIDSVWMNYPNIWVPFVEKLKFVINGLKY